MLFGFKTDCGQDSLFYMLSMRMGWMISIVRIDRFNEIDYCAYSFVANIFHFKETDEAKLQFSCLF
jgi:hypothetical protein